MNVAAPPAAASAASTTAKADDDGPSPTSAMASLHNPLSMSQEEEVEEEQEQELELELLGTVSTNTASHCQIVGIRYYTGVAHPGEFVQLQREPHNPYDRNAIRVDNMHHQKVGHVKREMAARLAPLMDRYCCGDVVSNNNNHQQLLTIDAIIPRPGNHYCLPIHLDFRGVRNDSSNQEMVQQVDNFLARVLYPSSRKQLEQQRRAQQATGSSSATAAAAAAASIPTVQLQAKKVDWKTQQKQLDDFFNQQSKQQLANLPDIDMPTHLLAETTRLFEHQVQGLKWLVHRERGAPGQENPFYKKQMEGKNNNNKQAAWFCNITNSSQYHAPKVVQGAILADDMGLGKTVQAIALILANPPEGRKYEAAAPPPVAAIAGAPTDGSEDDDDDQKPVAAILPPQKKPSKSAVKALKVPALKNVLLDAGLAGAKHGKKADMVAAVMAGLDAQTISLELYYNAIVKPPPVAPPVVQHSTTTGPTPQCTLIVCPVSVISNWHAQIEEHVKPGTLRVALYHGHDRQEVLDQINDCDVLITSYNTLSYDYGKENPKKKSSSSTDPSSSISSSSEPARKVMKTGPSIFATKFHRVLLDEAHVIRNAKSRTFKACLALQGERRICMSGTPITNRPEDLQALFEFMGDPTLGDKNIFRRAVTQPIKDGKDEGLVRLRSMMALVALRRNKSTADIKLVEKTVELRSVEFAPGNPHHEIYDTIFRSAKLAVQAAMQNVKDNNGDNDDNKALSHGSVFEILTRMRQACCSGKLIPTERLQRAEQVLAAIENKTETLTVEEGQQLLDKLKGVLDESEDSNPECAICFESMDENTAVVLKACGHVFCNSCIQKVSEQGSSSSKCPYCRGAFHASDMVKWESAVAASSSPNAPQHVALSQQMDEMCPSPKLEALSAGIREMKEGEKGVIFSQFTKFLNEIQQFLESNGYTFTRIDGSRTASQRIAAMAEFGKEEGGPRFMLCSLHAAGTGLNLTRGNHCFMMDTWFNQAVEQQAQDRIHRIGQTRPVRIIRFVSANSVESRMVDLQESKAALARGTFEKLTAEEKKKARMEDVKKLLEID